MRPRAPSVALAVTMTLLSGCSFAFVRRYSEPPPGYTSECTRSYRWPIVDTVVTAGAAALVVYAIATRERDGMPDTATPAMAGGGSVIGVTAGASAIFGALSVRTCRAEVHRFDQAAAP